MASPQTRGYANRSAPPDLNSAGFAVLISGLGELGATVVIAFQHLAAVRVHLFDPRPVRTEDVGGFFAAEDVGRAREEVVTRRVERAASLRAPAAADRPAQASVEASLAARLDLVDAVIGCSDEWDELQSLTVNLCSARAIPLVLARAGESEGLVGPVCFGLHDDVSIGCPECAERHRRDRKPPGPVTPAATAARPRTEAHIAAVARLAVLALIQALEVARGLRPMRARVDTVDFVSNTIRVDALGKHHACPICFPTKGATAETVLSEVRALLREPLSSRPCPPMELPELGRRLRPFVGEQYALLSLSARSTDEARPAVWKFFRDRGVDPMHNELANAHAAIALRQTVSLGDRWTAASEGFDLQSAESAETLAVVEGLERLFALSACAPDRVVHASFEEVAARACDPRSLASYADWQYREPGFPLGRFDPGQRIPWVGALDLGSRREVLVPMDFVYDLGTAAPLYRPTSSGAACHSSLNQAIVNAIYEAVERDAFQIAWLKRLSLPRLSFSTRSPDPWSVRSTLERLDMDLEHVDISSEFGIPVLLAVLRDRRNPDLFLVDMVASLNVHGGLRKLYREMTQFVYPYLANVRHFINERTFDPDPDRVVTFPDHAAFYQSRKRNALASFLTGSNDVRPFAGDEGLGPADSEAELATVVRRLSVAGMRVLVANCTHPMLRRVGLHAVRVLVPGLLPLNAVHRLRMLGSDRLRNPFDQGARRDGGEAALELNPLPHPFW